jgi:putative SbcD/Mre11-related phosphoesterase
MLTLLSPYPAALIESSKKKTIVIADPHIGWETALHEKGIHVPSQTPKILKKLVDLLMEHKPDALIIAGDVKYSIVASELGEWREIPEFFNGIKSHVSEIGVIRGNHDANLEPMLPENVVIYPAAGVVVEDVGLFHGHKWPSPSLLGCKTLMMGHIHPVVVIRDPAGFKITRQIWLRADCNPEEVAKVLLQKHGVKIEGTVEDSLYQNYGVRLKTSQIFVIPSFNDFLGGRPVNEVTYRDNFKGESLIGPVLRSGFVNISDSELFLLDGTYLGTLKQLRFH